MQLEESFRQRIATSEIQKKSKNSTTQSFSKINSKITEEFNLRYTLRCVYQIDISVLISYTLKKCVIGSLSFS